MSTPTNLLTVEVGGEYEVLESTPFEFDHFDSPASLEASDEIVVIKGTLTVSP